MCRYLLWRRLTNRRRYGTTSSAHRRAQRSAMHSRLGVVAATCWQRCGRRDRLQWHCCAWRRDMCVRKRWWMWPLHAAWRLRLRCSCGLHHLPVSFSDARNAWRCSRGQQWKLSVRLLTWLQHSAAGCRTSSVTRCHRMTSSSSCAGSNGSSSRTAQRTRRLAGNRRAMDRGVR
jgi:hypothetical protein